MVKLCPATLDHTRSSSHYGDSNSLYLKVWIQDFQRLKNILNIISEGKLIAGNLSLRACMSRLKWGGALSC